MHCWTLSRATSNQDLRWNRLDKPWADIPPLVRTQGFSFLETDYIFTTGFSIFLTECFNCNSTNQTSEIMSHLLAWVRSTRSNAVYATSVLKGNPSAMSGRISATRNLRAFSITVDNVFLVTEDTTNIPSHSGWLQENLNVPSFLDCLSRRGFLTRKSQKRNSNLLYFFLISTSGKGESERQGT